MALGKVRFVKSAGRRHLCLQTIPQAIGQRHHVILVALGLTHHDQAPREFDVLGSESAAFHEAQARPVEKLGHETVGIVEGVKEPRQLLVGEHDGEPPSVPALRRGLTDCFPFYNHRRWHQGLANRTPFAVLNIQPKDEPEGGQQ